MDKYKPGRCPIFTSAHDDEKPLVVIMAILICLVFASAGALTYKAMSDSPREIAAAR